MSEQSLEAWDVTGKSAARPEHGAGLTFEAVLQRRISRRGAIKAGVVAASVVALGSATNATPNARAESTPAPDSLGAQLPGLTFSAIACSLSSRHVCIELWARSAPPAGPQTSDPDSATSISRIAPVAPSLMRLTLTLQTNG